MPIPPHYLHLYVKPKLGTSFIRRLAVYNYQHEINAIGWYDTASFDIALRSVDEAQQFLDQMIGNRVAIYVDNPVEAIWEGFINRMTFSAGETQYSISLDEMVNRVSVQYNNGAITSTTIVNNTSSQAVYGIKEGKIDVVPVQSGTPTAMAAQANTVLARRAWPKASITRGSGNGLMHIECLGFYHTLEWEVWSVIASVSAISHPSAGTDNFASMLTTTAGAISAGNNTTFFNPADMTDIQANALTYLRTSIRGETFWQRFLALTEVGDGTNYWVVGITPTLLSGTRRMYYRPQNTDIEYTARQADGLRIRDAYGKLVRPWDVRPDCGIRISDMLIGWNGLGDDPTETWIRSISYDANSQTVDWYGDDDTTAEAAFQLHRVSKQTGTPFGAVPRLV